MRTPAILKFYENRLVMATGKRIKKSAVTLLETM